MGVFFKEKKIYYLFSVLSIVALCLSGGLLIVEGEEYSIFEVIRKRQEIPKGYLGTLDIRGVFQAGISRWLYLLLPVVSAPFASYLSEQRKSRFYFYVKGREGSWRYLRNLVLYAGISSAAVLLAGIGVFLALSCCFFHLIPDWVAVGGVMPSAGEAVLELCMEVLRCLAHLCAYSAAISLLASCFVYLYNDLFVDLSLALLVNYALTSQIQGESAWHPIILALGSGALYGLARKIRSEKL